MLTREGEDKFSLDNYGRVASQVLAKKEDGDLSHQVSLDDKRVVTLLGKLLEAMGEPATKRAVMTLPVFSSFITEVDIPAMKEEEVGSALKYQAESYIPVPVSEVELDWKVLQKDDDSMKVLLAAVPKNILQRYQDIARQVDIKLESLEIETFAQIRALDPGEDMWVLVDVGGHNTAIALVYKGFTRINRNISASGHTLTEAISQGLEVSTSRSEELKKSQGLLAQGGEKQVVQMMEPVLDEIVNEVDRIASAAFQEFSRKPAKVVITGGSSRLKGLPGYMQEKMRIPIDNGQPWSRVQHPSVLDPALKDLSPTFAVATGAAMR